MESHGPVLALMPFQATGGTEQDVLIAHGLLEDICDALTCFSSLQVVSWMSAMAVAELPDGQIGERLGATHVMRGRLRRSGDRMRITANLIECAGGRNLWSETFATEAADIFDIQDEIVGRIAATFAARLEETALKESRRKPTESLAAYELTLRGLTLLRQGTTEADADARALFERALALDPHYARAHAGLSLSWFNEWSCQFWDRFEENRQLAYQHAHRALDLDDSDPLLHLVIGRVLLYQREFEQASWYFDRALTLCPNHAENLIQLSSYETYLGRPENGLALAEKAMRLNPYHPNDYYAFAAVPHFVMRDFARALEVGAKATGAPVVDMPAYAAIALIHLGRHEEAAREFAAYHEEFRKRITFGREPEPGEPLQWFLDVNPYRRREDIDFLVESFRMLGADDTRRTAPATAANEDGTPTLLRHGDGWLATYAGRTAMLPCLKGLHDIHHLLSRPGEEFHCLDLAGRAEDGYGGDEALDDTARNELKARIRDLQDEINDAEDMNDVGRAERLRAEQDELVETLSRALGLGGRARRLGSLTERARTTVTWRIRHAVRKIEAVHGALARHFANSLRTGTFCSYNPERPTVWRLTETAGAEASLPVTQETRTTHSSGRAAGRGV